MTRAPTDKVKLGDYVAIRTGKLDANASSPDGEYPFFTCAKEPLKIAGYSYDCECILVAGNGDLNVKYFKGKFDAYQRTYIIEVVEKHLLDARYLFHFMDTYIDVLRRQSIGGVIKYIKLGNLTGAEIPLPPLVEQKRIAEELDNICAAKKDAEAIVEKLKLLAKSQFVEMFGSQDFPIVTMADVCKIITDGTHQPPKFIDAGIPFLLVSNIRTDEVNYEAEKFISEDDYKVLIKRTPIEIGDILLSTVGSYGHPAIVKDARPFCFQRHIAYLKPDLEKVGSIFLHAAILSDSVKAQIEGKVKGVAQKTLNLSEIRKLTFPLPPLSLQRQYAAFIEQLDKSQFEAQALIGKLDLLYRAKLQEYFG